MRSAARLVAAFAVAAVCVGSTWLRTEVKRTPPEHVDVERIAGASETGSPGWTLEGVWHYTTEPNITFGGYSALLPISLDRLRAFSDRGYMLTLTEPDLPPEREARRRVTRQHFADPQHYWDLWDAEAATIDVETGTYWVAFENTHAIHRYSYRSEPEKVRFLTEETEWGDNGGLEAMERLSDGRFLAIPEGHDEALIYPEDPISGVKARRIAFKTPAESYAVTDMAQLPDGRVLLLMRNVVWGMPPFAGLIAIGEPPARGSQEPWAPQVTLRFDGVLPPENYEGLAVRELEDGAVAVWVISDDNLASIQRTLLAKLRFEPAGQ